MPPRKTTKKAKANFWRSRRNAALLSGFRKYGRYIKKSGGKRYINRGKKGIKKYQNLNGAVNTSVVSFNNRSSKAVKMMEKLGAPNIRLRNFSYIWGTKTGYQGCNSLPHCDIPSLQQLNSNVNNNAGVPGPNRFCLDSYKSTMEITNTTTGTVEFEIMEIVGKRDISGFNFSKNGQTYTGGPYPDVYWGQGACQALGLPGSTNPPPVAFPGSTPYDTPLFKQFFKIVKRVKVILTQGGCHRHVMAYQPNKIIEQNLLDMSNFGIRGITRWTMIVQRGMPTIITDSGDPPASYSTLMPSNLSIVHSQRFRYQWLLDNTTNQFQEGALQTFNAKPNIVSLGSGVVSMFDSAS